METDKYFKMVNINPQNKITQDCVIRALSLFLEQDYYKTLGDLLSIYLTTGFHIADPVCFMVYLRQQPNYVQTNITTPEKIILSDMCQMLQDNDFSKLTNVNQKNSNKILVLLNNTHLTYLENGVIIDTWNCGSLNVQAYFIRKEV